MKSSRTWELGWDGDKQLWSNCGFAAVWREGIGVGHWDALLCHRQGGKAEAVRGEGEA